MTWRLNLCRGDAFRAQEDGGTLDTPGPVDPVNLVDVFIPSGLCTKKIMMSRSWTSIDFRFSDTH